MDLRITEFEKNLEATQLQILIASLIHKYLCHIPLQRKKILVFRNSLLYIATQVHVWTDSSFPGPSFSPTSKSIERNLQRPFPFCKLGAAYLEGICRIFQQEGKHSAPAANFRNSFLISRFRLYLCASCRQAAQCRSRQMAKTLGMKVRNTSFLGLWGCSLYKPVFLSGSLCLFTGMRGLG